MALPTRALILACLTFALCALVSCDSEPEDGTIRVNIGGERFTLETALDTPTRNLGLGERRELDPNGGMIFVFDRPYRQFFHMKDCYIDIDIAFLDDTGRVVTMYTMPKEAPQGESEPEAAYLARLKKYPSRFPSSVVIEVLGGRFADVGLKEGDVVDLDIKGLKARVE